MRRLFFTRFHRSGLNIWVWNGYSIGRIGTKRCWDGTRPTYPISLPHPSLPPHHSCTVHFSTPHLRCSATYCVQRALLCPMLLLCLALLLNLLQDSCCRLQSALLRVQGFTPWPLIFRNCPLMQSAPLLHTACTRSCHHLRQE